MRRALLLLALTAVICLGLSYTAVGQRIRINGAQYFSGNVVFTDGSVGIGTTSAPLAPVHVGDRAIENSVDSQVLISRVIDGTIASNSHAFSDSSQITDVFAATFGYNSFDMRIDHASAHDWDHVAGYQYAPTFTGAGIGQGSYSSVHIPQINARIIYDYAYNVQRQIGQGGQLSYGIGLSVVDTVKAGNAIFAGTQWGIKIASLTAGADNVAIETQGVTRNVLNGPLYQVGDKGSAGATVTVTKALTAMTDGTLTTAYTVTVPNAIHAAGIRVVAEGALGDGDSTSTCEYLISVSRVAGAVAKVVASSALSEVHTTGAAGDAVAVVAVSAVSGAADASNTFTIQVKVTKSAGTSANHKAIVRAEMAESELDWDHDRVGSVADDGTHLNATGQAIIAALVQAMLDGKGI